jgi:hypothetical protein
MKVRAVLLRDIMRKPIDRSSSLTLGNEYVVLAIWVALAVPQATQAQVHLLTDEGGRSSGLFDLSDFEITDDRPSRFWRVRFENSHLQLEPEAWMIPDFWETFHNENPTVPVPDVTERFDTTVRALFDEAGVVWKNAPAPWSTSDIAQR